MTEFILRLLEIIGSASSVASVLLQFFQRSAPHATERVESKPSIGLPHFEPEELQRFQELILTSAALLLIDQCRSGSWGRTMPSFVEVYLRTYSTPLHKSDLPPAPIDSPTFQRYAISGLSSVFGSAMYYPYSRDDSLDSIRSRLGDRKMIVKQAPPSGQTGLPKFYIDYHHTVTAAHSFLLATGKAEDLPLAVLQLLERHQQIWYGLYADSNVRDQTTGRTLANLAGVHMSDYHIFLSNMAERLSQRDHRDEKNAAIKLRNLVTNALVDSQDPQDSLWGYPEHARLLRTLWVLENVSQSPGPEFHQLFAPVVRRICEERSIFALEIIDQPLIGDQDPAELEGAYMRNGVTVVPSVGLTACLALLCHRLANDHEDSTFYRHQRDDLLRYLLMAVLEQPSLVINRTNFTFTWYCLCMLNSIFRFDYSWARQSVVELDRNLKALRNDPDFARSLVELHWGVFAKWADA